MKIPSYLVPTAVLVGALALAPFVLPASLITPLNYIGLYSMVCLGFFLLTGMVGLTSFGQAAFVGLGAYTTALLVTHWGWSPWISLFASLGITALIAWVLGMLTIRLSSHYLVLGTMAWGLGLYYLMGNMTGLGGYNGISGVPPIALPGFDTGSQRSFYVLVWSFNALLFLGAYNLLSSRQGRAIRSLRDTQMSQSFGIPTNRLKVAVFVIAALCAGLSGWLQAHYVTVVNPGPFGISASIDYLFMAVVGGTTSLAGAIAGPVVVEGLRTVVRNLIPGLTGVGGSYEAIIFGLAVIMLLRSAGGGVMAMLKKWLPDAPTPKAPAQASALPRRKMPAQGTPLLSVRSLGKRFGGLVAVDNVSFEMSAGEVLGVIGPNGAGKSTLFNLLTGVAKPSSGLATLVGDALAGRSAREISRLGVARSFQHVRLRPSMTLLENVALGAYSRGHAGLVAAILRYDRSEEACCLFEAQKQLDRVGLGPFANTLAGALPLGQQRTLEIARALAADPVLLLLDEPAAGLRHQEKVALAQLLEQLRDEGVSILLVEHDMDFVMNLVDRLVVLQYGQCIAEGSPQQVRSNPKVIEAYLGGLDGDLL